ncbi:hypothetical protein BC832DRAFT_561945 [Gaertneriomyces semiglobifer]|nr:hypothetical protein BC832DRAFT_561945 [Gaertneriomyces semiglobifer]
MIAPLVICKKQTSSGARVCVCVCADRKIIGPPPLRFQKTVFVYDKRCWRQDGLWPSTRYTQLQLHTAFCGSTLMCVVVANQNGGFVFGRGGKSIPHPICGCKVETESVHHQVV